MKDFPNIKHRVPAWASGEIGRGSARTGPYPSSPPHHLSEIPSSSSGPLSSYSAAGSTYAASTFTPALASTPSHMRREGRGVVVGSRAMQVPGAEAAALGFADCDRLTVASALLHGADLSSPGRPWGTCRVWVARLMEEFKFQAEQVCVLCGCVLLCELSAGRLSLAHLYVCLFVVAIGTVTKPPCIHSTAARCFHCLRYCCV